MIVMPANASGMLVGYIARQYENAPARLGHLHSPGRTPPGPWPWMPYVLDNGAFPAFANKRPWDVSAWRELVAWAANTGQSPLWALVPDVVADAKATIQQWAVYSAELGERGWPLAFAAQDGMEPRDVPGGASVVFLGGSTEWKWAHLTEWACAFPGRLHVGRVNGLRQLRLCADVGVQSCDGTGFSRTARQMGQLRTFLAEMNGEQKRDDQLLLFDDLPGETDHGWKYSTTDETALSGVEK